MLYRLALLSSLTSELATTGAEARRKEAIEAAGKEAAKPRAQPEGGKKRRASRGEKLKAAAQPSRATDAAARQGAARDFGAMAAQFDGKLASQQAHFEGELARDGSDQWYERRRLSAREAGLESSLHWLCIVLQDMGQDENRDTFRKTVEVDREPGELSR